MKKEEEKENIDGVEPRVYEVGFHLVPTLPEEGVSGAMDEVRESLTALDVSLIPEDIQNEVIELAYPMDSIVGNEKKVFDTAYFGWIKFETTPENILTIEAGLKKNPNVFRFLIIKTVSEDTFEKIVPEVKVVTKKNTEEKGEISKEKKKISEAPKEDSKKEISNEKVDKAIDELVVE